MEDDRKTKDELIAELSEMRRKLSEIEGRKSDPVRGTDRLGEANLVLRSLVQACPLPIIALDPDGNVLSWNRSAERVFGWSEIEVLGCRNPIVVEGNEEEFRELRDRVKGGEEIMGLEVVRKRKDDAPLHIRISAAPVRDSEGTVLGTMAVLEDVTEKKRIDSRLREFEARFRELADLMPQPVFETDENGYLTFINKKACELYGYSMEEFYGGFRAFQGIALEDRERGAENFRRIMRGERFPPNEYTAIRKDGTTFPVMIFSSPIIRQGKPVGTRGIIIDMSDRKKREEEFHRIQRLESIGTLAAGITHDFNNHLTAILANIALAKMDAGPHTGLHRALSEAEQEIEKTTELTRQLLFYSAGGTPDKRPVPVGELIRQAARSALRGSNVRCEFSFPDDCCFANADGRLLSQAFANLIVNADEAMPGGGTIDVACRIVDVEKNPVAVLPGGNYVKVRIRDSGAGIPKKNLGKIFDPYFSTKEKRSGLGLTTAHFIVKRHGGHIEVESDPDAGAAFSVYLPLTEEKAGEVKSEEIPRPSKGKILLMDDSDTLRGTVSRLLTRFGFEVGTAKDGKEAIGLYRDAIAEGKPFDAVVLDLTVPGGMGGRETIGRLLEIDPELRAIVSSGYPQDPVMINPGKYGFRDVVPKPYDIKELLAAFSRVLPPPGDVTVS